MLGLKPAFFRRSATHTGKQGCFKLCNFMLLSVDLEFHMRKPPWQTTLLFLTYARTSVFKFCNFSQANQLCIPLNHIGNAYGVVFS